MNGVWRHSAAGLMKSIHWCVRVAALAAIAAAPGQLYAQHSEMQHEEMKMPGMLGPYPMTREASGTSWQPEGTPMEGIHVMTGGWMLMFHGFADFIYDQQGGPRGGNKFFVPSMLMGMGQRDLGSGTLGVRAMLSLDPLMGKTGYPLLFQTGETADGVTPLVDRQHPHDLFMELAATYSVPVGSGSVFGYVGLPGEPALGPPAFMHRASGVDIPEAPLTHHWLDSTHITFGVVTVGATVDDWKFEASAFNGREPDQYRYDIEVKKIDSWSGRISFNPAAEWSLQASHGYLASSEQLEPEVSLHRTTASVSHAHAIDDGLWSSTVAVGVNHESGASHPGYLAESAWHFASPYSVFGRAEYLRTDHLFEAPSPLAGQEFGVGKLSLGGLRHLGATGALRFALGALVSGYIVPEELRPHYGSNPMSFMLFLQTRLSAPE